MSEPRIPPSARVRVLPAFMVVEKHNARFTAHRISDAAGALPHVRAA